MERTKQQEFVRFLNGLNLKRYMGIKQACIECQELAFCPNSWASFMANMWQVPESSFPTMWKIVDETYGKEATE